MMIPTYKHGDLVVSRYGSHNLVVNSVFDEHGQEWLTVRREDRTTAEFLVSDFTPWRPDRDEPWHGATL